MFKINGIRRQILFSGIAFAVIALLLGLWSHFNFNNSSSKELNLKSGTALLTPRIVKPFELQNAPNGNPFTNEQLKGHWSMLFFGFTNCALLCPTTLTNLNLFYNTLDADKVEQLPKVYFVSIDPERDSLKRINQYVMSFNKNFHGATGTEAQLNNITRELNILYAKVKPEASNDPEEYQIDHSGTVLVFNPDGNLIALFSPPIDPKSLADDYKLIIKESARIAAKESFK